MKRPDVSIRNHTKFLDLTGARFGRLLVLRVAQPTPGAPDPRARFVCLCDCGKEKTVVGGNLRRGATTSCGCYRSERASKRQIGRTVPTDSGVALAFLRAYKGGAKHRKLIFQLTDEEALGLALQDCTYCGAAPARTIKLYARKKSPQHGDLLLNGIDRVNNLLGYTLANCVSCCTLCNNAKKTLTAEEWFEYLDRLVAFRAGRK